MYYIFYDRELLDLYASCQTSKQVIEAQDRWLEKCEAEKVAAANACQGAQSCTKTLPWKPDYI